MVYVGELIQYLQYIEKEYGSDVPVIFQHIDNNDDLVHGWYARAYTCHENGTVLLRNKSFVST